jgi:hypothetical protein
MTSASTRTEGRRPKPAGPRSSGCLRDFAAAARAGAGQHARLVRCGGLLLLRLNDARGDTEQLAGAGDAGGSVAVGEQAIVADAVEALGQEVHEMLRDPDAGAVAKHVAGDTRLPDRSLQSEVNRVLDVDMPPFS